MLLCDKKEQIDLDLECIMTGFSEDEPRPVKSGCTVRVCLCKALFPGGFKKWKRNTEEERYREGRKGQRETGKKENCEETKNASDRRTVRSCSTQVRTPSADPSLAASRMSNDTF